MNKRTCDQTICCLQETHLRYKDKNRLKVKGWNTNSNQERPGVAMLISKDFKSRKITREKKEHYILIKYFINYC